MKPEKANEHAPSSSTGATREAAGQTVADAALASGGAFDITDGRNRYKPCPWCGATEGMGLASLRGVLSVECAYCGFRGPGIPFDRPGPWMTLSPGAELDRAAFDAWNRLPRSVAPATDSTPPRRDGLAGDVQPLRPREQGSVKGPSLPEESND